MNIYSALVVLLLFYVTASYGAADVNCHLAESEDGEVIYKECANGRSEIGFDHTAYVVSLSDDVPSKGLAVMWRTPKTSEMRDERYFILDYENMVVYDSSCLGGNFMMAMPDNQIIFTKYGTTDEIVFEQRNYNHCKQPLQTWSRAVNE